MSTHTPPKHLTDAFTRARDKLLQRRSALREELHHIEVLLNAQEIPRNISDLVRPSRPKRIALYIRTNPNCKRSDLHEALDIDKQTVNQLLAAMVKNGKVLRTKMGTDPNGWRYEIPAEEPRTTFEVDDIANNGT